MKKFKTPFTFALAAVVTMATPLFFTVTLTAPVALTTGCVSPGGTNGTSTAQIDATALILENSARAGAVAAITPPTGDTNNAAYFDLAAQAIGLFLTGQDYSPAAFQQALINVKTPRANDVWVQLGISAVIDLYQIYFSQYVQGQINGNFAAGTFLLAVQNGFNEALGKPTTPLPTKAKLQLKEGKAPLLPRPIKGRK